MKPEIRRCALYTRKSSEEGLDQSFNSLDAQREACAAYVKSQAHEGWRALPDMYDDGGFSGGSMERPALKRLLADIEAGKVDTVVVYKIDRLTRSLADFARMVELFDKHQVSFVSVTQQFNTTSSMGRLTLNVLLSFAQFEREVTGERIRDKIAASKAKGMWMGGVPPLGYDLPQDSNRRLIVNPIEAEQVRTIFSKYLELPSVHALESWLIDQGYQPKQRVTRSGRPVGGEHFSRGALFHLLRNRIYIGQIVHGERCYPGIHEAIVDEQLFAAVQAKIDAAQVRRASPKNKTQSVLTSRIFDADEQPMSPTFSRGASGGTYRYYVSAPLQQGRRLESSGAIRRVSGPRIEALVDSIARRVAPLEPNPLALVTRVDVHAHCLQLLMPIRLLASASHRVADDELIYPDPADPKLLRLVVPIRVQLRGGKSMVVGSGSPEARPDRALIKALRAAHAMVDHRAKEGPVMDVAPATPYLRRIVKLAYLAPDLQRMILDGRQPGWLTLERLTRGDLPISWERQRVIFSSADAI